MKTVDAVVIGSGFGGSVAACRLAQAGFDVCLLERGRRYAAADFPRPPVPGYPAERSTANLSWETDGGLFETRDLGGMQVVQAAGYGGGSLIYANVHMRAPARAFGSDGPWPADGPDPIDHRTLDPYYRLAASMLEVSPAPEDGPRAAYMAEQARRLGRDTRHLRPNLAINFTGDTPLPEIIDPREAPPDDPDQPAPTRQPLRPARGRYNRFGRAQGRCVQCAHCDLGCRYHAKNTLDLNYLTVAAGHGATVRTEAEVRTITRTDCGYRVDYWDRRFGAERSIDAAHVFVCAGAVNTTELLLRNWEGITDAPRPDALGRRFSGNGDSIGIVFGTSERAYAERGPVITSTLVYDRRAGDADDGFCLIQDAGLPGALLPLLDVLGYTPPHRGPQKRSAKRGLGWLLALAEDPDAPPPDPRAARRPPILPPLVGRLADRLRLLRRDGVIRSADMIGGLVTDSRLVRALGGRLIGDATRRTLTGLTDPARLIEMIGHFVGDFDGSTDRRALLLGMGLDPVFGRLHLDEDGGLWATRGAAGAHRIYQLQERLMYDFARTAGGRLRVNPFWGVLRRPITVHPMGGCPMGKAIRGEGEPDGVVDRYGEAYAAPGLYVLDAAAFPGAVGANPSATILAVAERNIERFIRRRGAERGDDRARWSAPERADCAAPPEPLYAITEAPGDPCPAPRTAAVGIEFRERLEGYLDTTSTPDVAVPFAGDGPTLDCLDGERRGLAFGSARRIILDLTCRTADLDGFLGSPDHPLTVSGTASIGDEPDDCPVDGVLKLMAPGGPKTRYLEYDLTLRGRRVRRLFGRKPVRDDPGFDLIRDLTTVYCALADFDAAPTDPGPDDPPPGPPIGPVWPARLGVLRVHLADFAHTQLPSIRIIGGPYADAPEDSDERLLVETWYTARFGRFFFGETLRIYGERLFALVDPGTRRPFGPRRPERRR